MFSSVSSFLSSLDRWAWVALIGGILVIPGVLLEGAEYIVKWAEHKRFRRVFRWAIGVPTLLEYLWISKTLKLILLPVESLGFLILCLGLAVEIFGSFESDKSQTAENFALSQSNTNLTLRIEELRSKNLTLEKELQPRRITMEQRIDFMALTQFLPKIQIKIEVGPQGFDTTDFAADMREMFNMAGFPTNSDARDFGFNEDIGSKIRMPMPESGVKDVLILSGEATNFITWFPTPDDVTNIQIIHAFVVNGDGTNKFQEFCALSTALNKIGFSTGFILSPDLTNGNCVIYIPIKP